MSNQYSDSEILTKKRNLSGVDLYLKSAFKTELENINSRKERHTEDDKIVIKYLEKRIKEMN
tara:strand:- start:142 stop:327 length:186 start_codon:yes stop_codon:yes gene_type:complete